MRLHIDSLSLTHSLASQTQPTLVQIAFIFVAPCVILKVICAGVALVGSGLREYHTHTHHIAATHHMYTHNYKHIQHHEHPHQAPRTLHDVIAEGCDSVLRKTLIAHACSEYL